MGAYDSHCRRDGRCLEVLGSYDPGAPAEDKRLVIKVDRIQHWLSVGALPTDKVAVLLKKQGVTAGGKAKASAAK
jgi:small subunit ribosomal protein S16